MFPQRHYRDAEIYLFRYQQCVMRAMTLIKMYFVGSLRAPSAWMSPYDSPRRHAETYTFYNQRYLTRPKQGVSPTAQTDLLCARFATVSQQLLPLLNEFECRARAYPHELSALLSECHSACFAARKSLLVRGSQRRSKS